MKSLVVRAEVAGKEQARFANLHLNRGRSENVAGIPQSGREAPRGLEPLVERDRLDLIIGRFGIGFGIDRLDRLLVLAILAAVTPLRFAFLDASGIGQHMVEKIARLPRRIDRPPETLGDQLWQEAAVVDMRVGQDDRSDFARIEQEGLAIKCFQRPGPLKQAAIDQDRAAIIFKLHA